MGETDIERAAIYCRVSTNSDSQTESLEKQVKEAIDTADRLGCLLVDQYIDSGKTGTTKDGRKEYQRLLADMEKGRFTIIITKSLDRVNRNILDFYLFLDLVIKNNIRLYFYLDRNFYKTDDKIIIGIKAILAEEYSRELSKKLCSAHTRRQEKGQVVMLSSLTYGYKKETQPDGSKVVVVVDEEAAMIRLIFEYCRQGYGSRAIGRLLYDKGYRSHSGNAISESSVRRIIRNPLVTGTMIMNKVRYDFNAKKTIYTDPSEWIWKENAVPPIISEEEWKTANRLMDSRLKVGKQEAGEENKNKQLRKGHGINQGKFDFSGKLICGICGKPYYKALRKVKTGFVNEWQCSAYKKFGRPDSKKTGFERGNKKTAEEKESGCENTAVQEMELINLLQEAASGEFSEPVNKQCLIQEIMEVLEQVMNESRIDHENTVLKTLERAEQRKDTLLYKYLDGNVSEEAYRRNVKKLEAEQEEIKKGLEEAQGNCDVREQMGNRLLAVRQFLEKEGVEAAVAYTQIEAVKKIVIYHNYFDVIYDSQLNFNLSQNDEPGGQRILNLKVKRQEEHRKYYHSIIADSKDMICEMMKENPKIRIELIAEKLGISKRTAFERIKALKEEKRIERKGQGKGSSWNVMQNTGLK